MFWVIALGTANGMRTMTPMAVICWAAYLGFLPVEGTWAFWTAKLVSVVIFTLLALGEYVGDTLPRTPSRTDLPLVAARLSFGVLTGCIIAAALNQPLIGGILLGATGALIGTYGGYEARVFGAQLVGHDLPVALLESAAALGLSLLAVQHIHREIAAFADRAMLTLGSGWVG